MIKYIIGRMIKACTHKPNKTVIKYIPNCPMVDSKFSISRIFDDTKNKIPNGDNQITQFVINIINELKLWKRINNGSTVLPSFPIAIPKAVENATKPRMFIPGTYSWVIFQS